MITYHILRPSLAIEGDGDGAVQITISCPNHPLHGTRLRFDRELATELCATLKVVLSGAVMIASFPRNRGNIMISMPTRGGERSMVWRFPTLAEQPRFKDTPPELVFPQAVAESLQRRIDRARGLTL